MKVERHLSALQAWGPEVDEGREQMDPWYLVNSQARQIHPDSVTDPVTKDEEE